MAGLGLICVLILLDQSGRMASLGLFFKTHHSAELIIVLVFLFSGLTLSGSDLRSGIGDVQGLLAIQGIVFIAAPLLAAVLGFLPLAKGIIIGLFLIAAMPTTMSSSVVMTVAAGGSQAQALLATITSSSLCVFTIPFTLAALLSLTSATTTIQFDKAALMLKTALLVVLPLAVGFMVRPGVKTILPRVAPLLQLANQLMVLFIIWLALSQSRTVLLNGGSTLIITVAICAFYHALMLAVAWIVNLWLKRGPGKRESILFAGGQKNLTLSIIFQVSLFSEMHLALVMCVVHHVVHLVMDGYLVGRLGDGRTAPDADAKAS